MFTQICKRAWLIGVLASVHLLAACGGAEAPAPATAGANTEQPSAAQSAPDAVATAPSQAVQPTLSAAKSESGNAALVNGAAIPLAEFNNRAAAREAFWRSQGVTPDNPEGAEKLQQVRKQVLEELIEQALIEEEARKQGVGLSEAQIDAEMQKAIDEAGGQERFDRWLTQTNSTRQDFRLSLRFELLGAKLREKVTAGIPERGEQVHPRHILVDDRQSAERLLARLKAGADFATLARQNSLDTATRESGGDLGWIPRGLTTPEFERAAFSLNKGQLSGVVQSPLGYHIILAVERQANRPISDDVQMILREKAFDEWLDARKAAARIERYVR